MTENKEDTEWGFKESFKQANAFVFSRRFLWILAGIIAVGSSRLLVNIISVFLIVAVPLFFLSGIFYRGSRFYKNCKQLDCPKRVKAFNCTGMLVSAFMFGITFGYAYMFAIEFIENYRLALEEQSP